MVAVTVEQKVVSILDQFVREGIEDALSELSRFSDDEFVFSVKFNKYKACLNAPAAQVIINFQNTIYKIAALHMKGKPDIRLLTNEEKQLLEVPFKITESSTIEEAVELLKTIKGLIKMLPEKHRAAALVAILFVVFGYLSWDRYLEYKEKMETPPAFELAIEKMHEQNSALTEIISKHEKSLLTELGEVDKEVEFQDESFSQDELQSIKRNKYPKKQIKEISNLKGVFTINDINIKDNYLIVEENASSDPIKIYYSSEDLLAQMQDIKNHLKDAIDNEGKRFSIEATIVKKNKKVDTRALIKISEFKRENAND